MRGLVERIRSRRDRQSRPPGEGEEPAYREWLSGHVARRAAVLARPVPPGRFSVLTLVYDGSPADLVAETAVSVLSHAVAGVEWVVLNNGCGRPELLAALDRIAADPRVHLLRSDDNVGIVAGLGRCLSAASGELVLTLDADDLLLPDALAVLSAAVDSAPDVSLLYSDEDMLVDGAPCLPYLRPDWDPVLNLCSSYIFHLCAFRREEALELGVYSDPQSEWCQDWDTVCRFAAAGKRIAHLPEVLYHWRQHPASSTNRPEPEAGSLASQRHVLERELADRRRPHLYEVAPLPFDRGATEWWIRRRRVEPEPMALLVVSGTQAGAEERTSEVVHASGYPFAETADVTAAGGLAELASAAGATAAGLAVVLADGLRPEGEEWPWEALCLLELHPDTVLVSGRILSPDRIVLGGGEILGFAGVAGTPERDRAEAEAGNFGLALKQRSVTAVHPSFFIAETDFLRRALAGLPPEASPAGLGAWLGGSAAEQGRRVVFSPLVAAISAEPLEEPGRSLGSDEERAFRHRFGGLLERSHYYSPHFDRRPGRGYRLAPAVSELVSR